MGAIKRRPLRGNVRITRRYPEQGIKWDGTIGGRRVAGSVRWVVVCLVRAIQKGFAEQLVFYNYLYSIVCPINNRLETEKTTNDRGSYLLCGWFSIQTELLRYIANGKFLTETHCVLRVKYFISFASLQQRSISGPPPPH